MSFTITNPEALEAAAGNLEAVGAMVTNANTTAAAATTIIAPAAADDISMMIAARFAAHAQSYQAVSVQAHALLEQFTATLRASAGSYAATEAANAAAG